jgi:hypothetical protein
LAGYFPKTVLDALVAASRRYLPAPGSESDPRALQDDEEFLELPQEDMPIVVAARLSLSFPLLFAAVPLWAIDYEAQRGQRRLRRCLFTDGGVSSNFPIHLFDNAIPRWPTFGLWLDKRSTRRPPRDEAHDQDVWLPKFHDQGWGDNWNRFDPLAADGCAEERDVELKGPLSRLKYLSGFLLAALTSATDWRDRTNLRMPHVRNRVARLRLRDGETGLHIGMSSRQILHMAHRYGTTAGRLFVARFKDRHGVPSRAWQEQRWVRFMLMLDGLKERLHGLKHAAEWSSYTVPLPQAIEQAVRSRPIASRRPAPILSKEEADSLKHMLAAVEDLEATLHAAKPSSSHLVPTPELRLRAPL